MGKRIHHGIALWLVHDVEDDMPLIIRSNSGHVFHCNICPSQFVRSPSITEQYFKCLELLRSGQEEIDHFYQEDAEEWLLKTFKPLITQLSPSPEPGFVARPTLADYFFPKEAHVCHLTAMDDELYPQKLSTKDHGWMSPIVKTDTKYFAELEQWTQCYAPSDVHICYDRPEDSLIKPPKRTTVVGQDGQPVTCFFKKFNRSRPLEEKKELDMLRKITETQIPSPPEAYISRLLGVVCEGDGILGMLFAWVDRKVILPKVVWSKARAAASPPELRKRWASQISKSLNALHKNGLTWSSVQSENFMIDRNDDAWLTVFGSNFVDSWVDKDKTGTPEGDSQGFRKILDILDLTEEI